MTGLLLALALAAPAAAEPCWTEGARAGPLRVHLARVDPARLRVDYGARSWADGSRAGVVVTNGTFFGLDPKGRLVPIGTVVSGGVARFSPSPLRITSRDGRLIDLDQRWGIGVDGAGRARVLTGAQARSAALREYLGGAGLLLSGGAERLTENAYTTGQFGPSFASDVLAGEAARTAAGITAAGELLLVHAPHASLAELAAALKALGARDAVFYDGGGAAAFAAGPPGSRAIDEPPEKRHDRNPSRLVVTSCR